MNVVLFIAPKNQGYASVAKKFCQLMDWKPVIIDLERPYNYYKKTITELKQVDIVIIAGFRDNIIFHARDIKEKFKSTKTIQFSNPRYENGETMPAKEIEFLDVIVDWEKSVIKNQLPKHTKLISLDYPPSNRTKEQLKKIYKGKLQDDLLIFVGSSLQEIKNISVIKTLDRLLSIRKFKKIYISYNARSFVEKTKEGDNLVNFIFSYIKSKKIRCYKISRHEKFLRRLINKSYIAQLGNSQVITDALYVSKMLNLERYHIIEYFNNENDFEPFIKKLKKNGWVCDSKLLKKSDLSSFMDTMDIMVKEISKVLSK